MTITRFQVGPRMSQGVVAQGMLHIAGQVADNRKGSIEEQTRDVLARIEALLREAGTTSPGW